MVSYVEEAILRTRDQSTPVIRRINRELATLFRYSRRVINIRVETTGMQRVTRDVNRVRDTLRALSRTSGRVNLDVVGASQARARISEVGRQLDRIQRRSVGLSVSGTAAATRNVERLRRAIMNIPRSRTTRIGVNIPNITAQISTINRHLDRLSQRRAISIPFSMPGLATVAAQLRSVTQMLSQLGRRSGVSIRVHGSGAGGVPPSVRLDAGNLESILNAAWHRLAAVVENAIISGFQRGAVQQDVAGTRLALLGRSPEEVAATLSIVQEVQRMAPSFGIGEAQGLASEVLPIVRGDTVAAEVLAGELARAAELQVALGASREAAQEVAHLLGRAGEQTGRFTDAVTGAFDLNAIRDYFTVVRQAMVHAGREMTPQMVAGSLRLARQSRFSLDDEGLMMLLLSAEEQGTTAGVGVNQLIRQLTGERVQRRVINRLTELGLMDTREIVTGTTSGRQRTEIVADGLRDEELFRQNPLLWVNRHLIPIMRQEGFDPANPVDAARFAGQITSDRTATAQLTELLTRNAELMEAVSIARGRDVSHETVSGILSESLTLQWARVQGQFISMLGEIARSMETILLPAFRGIESVASALAHFVAGPDGEGSVTRATLVAGGGAAAVGAGLVGIRRFMGFAALNSAGIQLNTAGGLLITAAQRLMGAGTGAGAARGAAAGAGGAAAAGAAGGAAGGAARRGILQAARRFWPVALAAVATEIALRDQGTSIGGILNDAIADRAADATVTEAFIAANNITVGGQGLPQFTDPAASLPRLEHINRQIDAVAEILRPIRTGDVMADSISPIERESITATLNDLMQQRADLQRSIADDVMGLLAAGADVTPFDPALLGAFGVEVANTFANGSEQMRAVFNSGAADFAAAGDTLIAGGGTFGQMASDALLAAAPVFGNAIAAVIANAVNNINVNVNQQGGPRTAAPRLDTGTTGPQQ